VKATGSTAQITYQPSSKRWIRRPAVAAKHEHEIAIDLATGKLTHGVAHAPLIYAKDPRIDLPTALEQVLQQQITQIDDAVIRG
jgi:hypothetical protein